MLKYHPYKSDKPGKKYYIITNDNQKVYFGAAGMSDFTIHKMNKGNKDILIGTKIVMKIGQNLALIHQVGGPTNSCGVIQLKKKHTTI
jgi:hypothetical protein